MFYFNVIIYDICVRNINLAHLFFSVRRHPKASMIKLVDGSKWHQLSDHQQVKRISSDLQVKLLVPELSTDVKKKRLKFTLKKKKSQEMPRVFQVFLISE